MVSKGKLCARLLCQMSLVMGFGLRVTVYQIVKLSWRVCSRMLTGNVCKVIKAGARCLNRAEHCSRDESDLSNFDSHCSLSLFLSHTRRSL